MIVKKFDEAKYFIQNKINIKDYRWIIKVTLVIRICVYDWIDGTCREIRILKSSYGIWIFIIAVEDSCNFFQLTIGQKRWLAGGYIYPVLNISEKDLKKRGALDFILGGVLDDNESVHETGEQMALEEAEALLEPHAFLILELVFNETDIVGSPLHVDPENDINDPFRLAVPEYNYA